MQTIYLITTGGTIEKIYSEQSGRVLNVISKIREYLESCACRTLTCVCFR
jgi:hypothetical protein